MKKSMNAMCSLDNIGVLLGGLILITYLFSCHRGNKRREYWELPEIAADAKEKLMQKYDRMTGATGAPSMPSMPAKPVQPVVKMAQVSPYSKYVPYASWSETSSDPKKSWESGCPANKAPSSGPVKPPIGGMTRPPARAPVTRAPANAPVRRVPRRAPRMTSEPVM